MKKKLFPIAFAIIGALTFASCSSSDDPSTNPSTTVTNDSIDAVMTRNYYWNIPTNPNTSQDPVAFFNSLLNAEDKYTVDGVERKYSSIYIPNESTVSYDIGFEYSANLYSGNAMLYVIDYIKPGTNASDNGLKRGFLIKSVNGETVTASNSKTLLPNAIANSGGKAIKMDIANPYTNLYTSFDITPQSRYDENAVYQKNILNIGSEKLGYLVYNAFNSKNNQQLKDSLAEFTNVDYLVLDLRYNASGNQQPAQILGSAIVQADSKKDPFLVVLRKSGSTNLTYPFVSDVPQLPAFKKVYVIMSQSTIGISEVFINALKAYQNNLVLVGEATPGRNMSVGGNSSSATPYTMNIVLGKWANKNLESFGAIQPTISVETPTILEPLGSEKEAMLAAIISNIKGQSAVRSLQPSSVKSFGSSSTQKATTNENGANLVL